MDCIAEGLDYPVVVSSTAFFCAAHFILPLFPCLPLFPNLLFSRPFSFLSI